MIRLFKKSKKKSINNKFVLYALIIVAAISMDFVVSSVADTLKTFRYEAEFDAYSAATVKVGIVPSDYSDLTNSAARSASLTYQQVEDMVRKAIELQGGLEWVIDKGDNVMIKVNLVGADSPSGQGENTDVRVVKSLVKIIDEYTEGNVKISIAEGTARTNDDPNSNSSVWANTGYKALLTDNYLSGIDFQLLNLNQPIEDIIEIDLGNEGMSSIQGTVYGVHRAELEADVYITVPVLKVHDTGITNALKLQVGSAPGCYYGYNKMKGTSHSVGLYHDLDHRRWTSEMIVDLCNIADIDFVVVDALNILETYKSFKGNNQVRMNTIVAGVDPVAVDHVCTRMLGMNPDDIAHITLAEKAGLGTNDSHKIIIEGAAIEEVKKRVKKNTSENGKFGQSNRTWILAGPFDGTDITTQFITDEAHMHPEPGKDGWTEAVYFFDDRIDLSTFYGNKTNIISYAYTHFSAPKAQEAELWLGMQEAIQVYVNGDMVYSSTATKTYGDSDIGSKVKTITLKEGENSLMVKTLNRFGDYSFALNICEPESNSTYAGNRVENLKFYQKSFSTDIENLVSNVALKVMCYPNPVKDFLTINFTASSKSNGQLSIRNIQGKVVKTLQIPAVQEGQQSLTWDLTNNANQRLAAGIYLCTLKVGNSQSTVQFMVLE